MKEAAETDWREHVRAEAGKQGLAEECLAQFDEEIQSGIEPAKAAWHALYDWDCLPLGENP